MRTAPKPTNHHARKHNVWEVVPTALCFRFYIQRVNDRTFVFRRLLISENVGSSGQPPPPPPSFSPFPFFLSFFLPLARGFPSPFGTVGPPVSACKASCLASDKVCWALLLAAVLTFSPDNTLVNKPIPCSMAFLPPYLRASVASGFTILPKLSISEPNPRPRYMVGTGAALKTVIPLLPYMGGRYGGDTNIFLVKKGSTAKKV